MNILAFDTSTSVLDICLSLGGEIHRLTRHAGLRHSELLIPGIEYLLQSIDTTIGDIDLIVSSKGPGSFTGLRIGISTAKGLSMGSGCPVVSVPTLEALAYPYREYPGAVLPIIDAKKKRFYAQFFKKGEAVTGPMDAAPDELLEKASAFDHILCTGIDSGIFLDRIENNPGFFTEEPSPRGCALSLIVLGRRKYEKEGGDSPGDGPLYMRKSDAEIEKKKGR